MITYASHVSIGRPPEDVFPYLVELNKQALWSDVQMTPLTDGDLRRGSRMQLTFGKPPMKASIVLEMTAVEGARRTAWTTISGPIKWDGEYLLEPTASGGTHLSQRGTMRFGGVWRLFEPLVGAEIKSGELKELEQLKAIIEAS